MNIPGSVEILLTFFLWSGTTLDVPVFIKNFFCLNVGHLSTSDDVIDKMAYVTVTTGVQCRHSRNCSNGSYLKSFDIVLVFYVFEYSLMNFRGGRGSSWDLLFIPCIAEVPSSHTLCAFSTFH